MNMSYKISHTAFGVARARCVEMFYPPEQRLFDDPYSIKFLLPFTRILMNMMRWKWVREWFLCLADRVVPGLTGGIICRTRYIDDLIQHCVNEGITSVINLGAGLDTRGLRLSSLSRVTYYEVDYADIMRYKQMKILALQGSLPHHLRLVSVDFQKQSVEARLRSEGWKVEEKTLFILEGVIQYITPEAFHALLTLVSRAVEESNVVFTYPMQDFLDGSEDYGKIHRLLSMAKYVGIARHNGLLPETLQHVLEPYSLEVFKDVGAEDYQQSFLQGLHRKLSVWAIERIALARIHR
jgi:methyltransferase (TIGR00027 family)